jgi:ferrochelatase
MGEEYQVFNSMRYGSPGLDNTLEVIKNQNYKKIIVLPLFPQYASATTGSVFQFVLSKISTWNTFPELHFIDHFHNHPAFVAAFAANAQKYQSVSQWDHVIFSFHGLPLKQVNKVHPEKSCNGCKCRTETIEEGRFCYQAACYETARLISSHLGLTLDDYSISFQSRLTKNWMTPFTDEILIKKAKDGMKKILILAPSFVADCLETKVEIAKEYQLLFQKHGGEVLQLVEGLNDNDLWVEGLKELIESHT